MDAIEKVLTTLSPEEQQKVLEFISNLKDKSPNKRRRILKVNWKGALKEYKDTYTSVQLQHMVESWWTT